MNYLLSIVLSLFLFWSPSGPDVPAPGGVFALTGATIYTISNGVIENGTVIIRDGTIEAVGTGVSVPADAVRIDCSGKYIYPGFIDSGTGLGLVEVGSAAETNDRSELGSYTPQMQALTAVNPNASAIPVTRLNGVTTVLTVPTGGLLPGTAALIQLHGYTPDQMFAGFKGIVMNFPSTGRRGSFDRRSDEDIKKASEKAMTDLDELWDRAETFTKMSAAWNPNGGEKALDYQPEMEALAAVVRGDQKLLLEVNAEKDIKVALEWIKKRGYPTILTGAAEGWRVANLIAEAGVPVITGPVLSQPTRSSDRYDRAYANAGLMLAAGVKVALRTNETSNVRNLPFHAGFAAAYGMGKEEALKAVTIIPAEIFGVSDRLGSIEAGKSATLFVTDGDAFETLTQVLTLFIDGYQIEMRSRQTELYDEFLNRTPGLIR